MAVPEKLLHKEELLRQLGKYMLTPGELLDLVEQSAREHRGDIRDSLSRNRKMYELTNKDILLIRKQPLMFQRFIDAIFSDFINYLALERGGDRGERPKDIRGKR